jgi:septation ring formation regulator EzrA
MKKILSILSVLLVAGILAGSLAFVPASSAMAQENIEQALTKAYDFEQTWLSKQQTAIDKATQASAKVQELIDKAAASGLDVTALQNALGSFDASMSSVNAEHQSAASALSAHNGFDESGNVTDRQAARETVTTARRALGNAHMTMTQATWALRDAIEAWKNANFPQG